MIFYVISWANLKEVQAIYKVKKPWRPMFIKRSFAGATLFNNTDYTKYPKYLFWVVVFHFLIILPVNCYN